MRINDALIGGEIPWLTTVFLSEFPGNFCNRFRKTSNHRTEVYVSLQRGIRQASSLVWGRALTNSPRSIYQNSNMTPRLSDHFSLFGLVWFFWVWFSLSSSLFWESQDKGVVKNLQFWPWSLGVMLEFSYIKRGLLEAVRVDVSNCNMGVQYWS